jgi:outer membrane protein assembly factor BamA
MVLAVAAVLIAIAASAPPTIPDDAWLYRDRRVGTVRVEGLDARTSSLLRAGLAVSADEAVFFPSVLEEDLVRVRLFLACHGHAEPAFRVTVGPSRRGRNVSITFHVESRPVLVEFLRFEGTPAAVGRKERDLTGALVDQAFTDAGVDSAKAALLRELRMEGHARATVESRVERTAGDGAGMTMLAEPGSVFYWGDTVVEGLPDDLTPLAARVANLTRGGRYSPRDVERAEENLRLLGLFGRIRVATEPVAPDTLEVRVEASVRRPRSVRAGLGYWTDDGIRGGAQWEHRNFFERGRSLGVGAVASQYKQEGFISTRWPALLAPRIWTEVRLALSNATEDNYEQLETSASLSNRWWFTSRSSLVFGLGTSRVKVDGRLPDFDGERNDFLVGLSSQLQYDGSDHILRPTRGRKLNVGAEWAPASVSDNEYAIVDIEGVHYLRLPFTTVLTSRVLVGGAKPLGQTESLLPDRRFYSGGASSHRGFARRQLGPLDRDGNPIGGEAVFNASLDLRFPIFRRLRGALFVDAGQVWFRSEDVQLGSLEVAIGPGLWIDTAVGPFRFDVGFRITDVSPAPRQAHHIAIGKPF